MQRYGMSLLTLLLRKAEDITEAQKRRLFFCKNYGIPECPKFFYMPRFKYGCVGCAHADFVDDLECENCRYLFYSDGATVCLKNQNGCGDTPQRSIQCLRFDWKEVKQK